MIGDMEPSVKRAISLQVIYVYKQRRAGRYRTVVGKRKN